MESVRLKKLITELDDRVALIERVLSGLRFEPDYTDLDNLLRGQSGYMRETKRLTGKLESLRQARPYLVAAVERALREETVQRDKSNQKEMAQGIKKVAAKVAKVKCGTVEQAKLLLELSKLRGTK